MELKTQRCHPKNPSRPVFNLTLPPSSLSVIFGDRQTCFSALGMIHAGVGMQGTQSTGVMVTSADHLNDDLTIGEHLRLFGWKRPYKFGLDDIRNLRVGCCLQHQRRRLSTLLAFARVSDGLVLLNEPTAGMSKDQSARFVEDLGDLCRGRSIAAFCFVANVHDELLKHVDRAWQATDSAITLQMNIPRAIASPTVIVEPPHQASFCAFLRMSYVCMARRWASLIRQFGEQLLTTALISVVHMNQSFVDDRLLSSKHQFYVLLCYWSTCALSTRRIRATDSRMECHWLQNGMVSPLKILGLQIAHHWPIEIALSVAVLYVATAILNHSPPSPEIVVGLSAFRLALFQMYQMLLLLQQMRKVRGFRASAVYLWFCLLTCALFLPFSSASGAPLQILYYGNPVFWLWELRFGNTGIHASLPLFAWLVLQLVVQGLLCGSTLSLRKATLTSNVGN